MLMNTTNDADTRKRLMMAFLLSALVFYLFGLRASDPAVAKRPRFKEVEVERLGGPSNDSVVRIHLFEVDEEAHARSSHHSKNRMETPAEQTLQAIRIAEDSDEALLGRRSSQEASSHGSPGSNNDKTNKEFPQTEISLDAKLAHSVSDLFQQQKLRGINNNKDGNNSNQHSNANTAESWRTGGNNGGDRSKIRVDTDTTNSHVPKHAPVRSVAMQYSHQPSEDSNVTAVLGSTHRTESND